MKNGSPVDYSTANGEQTAGRIFTLPAYQDIEMVYDLYTHVIKASECLGIDSAFREKVAIARNKLLPLKIGRYGQLQEWIDDVDNPPRSSPAYRPPLCPVSGKHDFIQSDPCTGTGRQKIIRDERKRKVWRKMAPYRR